MKKINLLAGIILVACMAFVYYAIKHTPPNMHPARDMFPAVIQTVPAPAASAPQLAEDNGVSDSNQTISYNCKSFSAHWAIECMDFGPQPLTSMQKAQRFNACSLYASKVTNKLAEGIDTSHADDAQKIAQIHEDLLKLCVLEGRDHFPSDADIDASFRKLDQMAHRK